MNALSHEKCRHNKMRMLSQKKMQYFPWSFLVPTYLCVCSLYIATSWQSTYFLFLWLHKMLIEPEICYESSLTWTYTLIETKILHQLILKRLKFWYKKRSNVLYHLGIIDVVGSPLHAPIAHIIVLVLHYKKRKLSLHRKKTPFCR